MEGKEFQVRARKLVEEALYRLLNYSIAHDVITVQSLIESLTGLVEEYKGVLDEHDDPSLSPG